MKKVPVSQTGPASKVGKTIKSCTAAELLKKRLVDLGFAKGQKGLPPSLVLDLEDKVSVLLANNTKTLEANLAKAQAEEDEQKQILKKKAAEKLTALETKFSDQKAKLEVGALTSLTKGVETAITAVVLGKLLAASLAKGSTPSPTTTASANAKKPIQPPTDQTGQGTTAPPESTTNSATPEGNLPAAPVIPPADSGDDLFAEKADGEPK